MNDEIKDDLNEKEFRILVIKEFESLNDLYTTMMEEMYKMRVEIETIKAKSTILGLIGGAIPIVILLILKYL